MRGPLRPNAFRAPAKASTLVTTAATLLLLDGPTDNLDLTLAEALQNALNDFEGAVAAVTHDRWFARSFDRFLHFHSDGRMSEVDDAAAPS